jgi:hypothetical protein|tara:strand:- start:936 stop:1061 length:126 start_codon:yes stop_codon:yes gene_type:complete
MAKIDIRRLDKYMDDYPKKKKIRKRKEKQENPQQKNISRQK